MLGLKIAFLALALLGHSAFWVGVVNRWHATGFPRVVVKSITLIFYVALVAPVLAAGWFLLVNGVPATADRSTDLGIIAGYLGLSALYGAIHLASWTWRQLSRDRAG